MLNVCWNQESGEIGEWGFEVAKRLRAKKINVKFVVVLKDIYDLALKKGFDCELLINPDGGHIWQDMFNDEILDFFLRYIK